MKIEDGTGSGKSAGVDSENRLLSDSVSRSLESHTNLDHGDAYSLLFSATPAAPADCFLYLKNEDEKDLIIEGFGLYLLADEYVDVVITDAGTPLGGTDIVPGNLNAGSGKTASGTFQHGNDITGLDGGRTIYRIYHTSSTGTDYTNFEMDVVLSKNTTLTMYVQTGTAALAGFLDMYYHTHDE